MQDSVRSVGSWAAKLWQGWAEKRLQEISNDAESCVAHQNALQSAIKERQGALERLNIQIENTKQKRNGFEEKMKADEESGRKFVALLEQAYFDELCKRRQRIAKAPTSTHAFFELLASDQLLNERSKLINTLS